MVDLLKMPSEKVARERLLMAAEELQDSLGSVPLGIWEGESLNVALARVAKTKELRAKGVQNWSSEDFDFVTFKSMTTMGDENTFKFVLPRFLLACAIDAEFIGWASDSHVLLSKCQKIDLSRWPLAAIEALLNAMESFAVFEYVQKVTLGRSVDGALVQPQPGVLELLNFVDVSRQEIPSRTR